MGGVDQSAIVTVASVLGVGTILGVLLRFWLERAAKHVDDSAKHQQSATEELTKQQANLFAANETLRRDLYAEIDRLRAYCESLRTQLADERQRGDTQDEALEKCERHSAEVERRLGAQVSALGVLRTQHEKLTVQLADSETAREALRVRVAAMEVDRKRMQADIDELQKGRDG